jgi:hypothetical protein
MLLECREELRPMDRAFPLGLVLIEVLLAGGLEGQDLRLGFLALLTGGLADRDDVFAIPDTLAGCLGALAGLVKVDVIQAAEPELMLCAELLVAQEPGCTWRTILVPQALHDEVEASLLTVFELPKGALIGADEALDPLGGEREGTLTHDNTPNELSPDPGRFL